MEQRIWQLGKRNRRGQVASMLRAQAAIKFGHIAAWPGTPGKKHLCVVLRHWSAHNAITAPVVTIVVTLSISGKDTWGQGGTSVCEHPHDQAGHDPELQASRLPPSGLCPVEMLNKVEDVNGC